VVATGVPAHRTVGETSDSQLLSGVHLGDERAFEELFMRHYGWLMGVVIRVTGDSEEAEEIVQDTFLRLYQRPIVVDDDVNVRGWLYTVAANTAFNSVRARNRRAGLLRRIAYRVDSCAASDDPLAIVTAMDDATWVRRCLALLPNRQRHVLLLRASGHSYAEIAAIIGVKPGSVGTILTRAEKALRDAHDREHIGNGDRT
jgi:RNA polymerase sigma factor (sigma-70 family)